MAKIVWIAFPVAGEASDVVVNTTILPNGTSGVEYSAPLSASGGTTPYAWTVVAGSVPTNLTLSTAGVLSGTPSASGVFSFTVRVTDSTATPKTDDQAFAVTIAVAPTEVTVVTAVLPQGLTGVAYTATLSATGGTGPYTFQHVSGKPSWMTIASNGDITGTPDAAAVSSIVVTATDSLAAVSAQKTISLTVTAALSMTTTSPLASGQSGVAYSITFEAAGGTTPYTWSLQSGAFPTPLALSASTGVLSGTPNESGTFAFTVRVADNASTPATVDRAFDLTIAAAQTALAIVQTSIPGGKVGVVYTQVQMEAVGGTAPYTWDISAGALPTGLAISSGGLITGTPTAAGTFTFTVRVTDSVAATATSGSFTVVITADTLTITTSVLPIAPLNEPYSAFLLAQDNTGAVTWAFVSGKPSWLSVNAATGELTGTAPAVETTYTDIVVSATDSVTTVEKTLSLFVTAEGPHTYFDTYKVHANIWRVRKLRDQAELDALNSKGIASEAWTYVTDPALDDHPLKQDGAKLEMLPKAWVRDRVSYPAGAFKWYSSNLVGLIPNGASKNEGTGNERNLILGLGNFTAAHPGSMTIVHDMWWDEVWRTKQKATTNNFKCNFIWTATGGGGQNPHLCEHASPSIASAILNQAAGYHPQIGRPSPTAPGRISQDTYNPTGQGAAAFKTVRWPANKWTRVWIHIEFNVPKLEFTEWAAEYSVDMSTAASETYDACSIWMREENGDLVRAYYRVPMSRSDTLIKEWRWAFDFSGNNLAGMEKHRIDLGDIADGDFFTITVPAYTNVRLGHTTTEQTTAPITFAADMSTQIRAALNSAAFTAVDQVYASGTKKISSTAHIYSIQYSGAWSNQTPIPLVTINPTGFTPGAVTRLQTGNPNHSITDIMYCYARNFLCFRDLPLPSEADTAFFAAPRGGDGRV